MRMFEVLYEVPGCVGESEPGVRSCRVAAPSADWAAEKVAKAHNARVNCRDLWIHAVRELTPSDSQAADGDPQGRSALFADRVGLGGDSPGSVPRPPRARTANTPVRSGAGVVVAGLRKSRRQPNGSVKWLF